jgi:hypothetical protein
MVGINERMGFVRHTAWITLQRDEAFDAEGDGSEFPGMS